MTIKELKELIKNCDDDIEVKIEESYYGRDGWDTEYGEPEIEISDNMVTIK